MQHSLLPHVSYMLCTPATLLALSTHCVQHYTHLLLSNISDLSADAW